MREKFFNVLKKSIFLILILPCIFIFSACGSTSAYDIAKQNGFSGSEEEWLDSLKGKTAYQIAVENGFSGSEEEWLDSLKPKSAYDIAVENGFVGTEQEWLDSLNGHDGTNGKDGKDAEKIDSYDMYLSAKQKDGYSGTYLEFLKTLSNADLDQTSAVLNNSAMSVVSVFAGSNGGSGVVYKYNDDGSAYILTNRHVTRVNSTSDYPSYTVYTYASKTPIHASFVAGSLDYDIAILKIDDASPLKTCKIPEVVFANHSLGETCYAIGDNSGAGIAITRGIVSSDSEYVSYAIGGTKKTVRCFRHDSYIDHGNSGGGLFNSSGKLIGLTNGGAGSSTDLRNYAIPSKLVVAVAENILENLNEYGCGVKFNLGLSLEISSASSVLNTETSKIETTEILKISNIKANSYAGNHNAEATESDKKFMLNDTLVSITIQGKNYKINRLFDLEEFLLTARVGDNISLELKRNESTINIDLFLNYGNELLIKLQ